MVLSGQKREFITHKAEGLSRSEIIGEVGSPDVYLGDKRVAAYRLTNRIKRRLIMICIIPVEVDKYPAEGEVAFLQFDEQDRLVRAEVRTVDSRSALRKATELFKTNSVPKIDGSPAAGRN